MLESLAHLLCFAYVRFSGPAHLLLISIALMLCGVSCET